MQSMMLMIPRGYETAEPKAVLGGYWMIQVKSKEEAIEWASRCPAGDNAVIKLRRFTITGQQPMAAPRPADREHW